MHLRAFVDISIVVLSLRESCALLSLITMTVFDSPFSPLMCTPCFGHRQITKCNGMGAERESPVDRLFPDAGLRPHMCGGLFTALLSLPLPLGYILLFSLSSLIFLNPPPAASPVRLPLPLFSFLPLQCTDSQRSASFSSQAVCILAKPRQVTCLTACWRC